MFVAPEDSGDRATASTRRRLRAALAVSAVVVTAIVAPATAMLTSPTAGAAAGAGRQCARAVGLRGQSDVRHGGACNRTRSGVDHGPCHPGHDGGHPVGGCGSTDDDGLRPVRGQRVQPGDAVRVHPGRRARDQLRPAVRVRLGRRRLPAGRRLVGQYLHLVVLRTEDRQVLADRNPALVRRSLGRQPHQPVHGRNRIGRAAGRLLRAGHLEPRPRPEPPAPPAPASPSTRRSAPTPPPSRRATCSLP